MRALSEIGGNDITIYKAALPDAKSRDRGAALGVGARWYFTDPWSVSVQAARFDDNLRQLMFGVDWGLRGFRTESTDTD